jgi:hypothetical protein
MEDQTVNETQTTQTPQTTQESAKHTQPYNSTRENNLTEMRRRLDAEAKARQAAEQRAEEAERIAQSYNQPQQVQQEMVEDEDDFHIDNDDYVQAKHVKTSTKKIKNELVKTKKELEELKQQFSYLDAKINTDSLKDFNKVVSSENLKTFAQLYPEDYESMMSNPNLKARSKTAYNMIKNYGIAADERDNLEVQDAEDRLKANRMKPKNASTAAPQQPATPLSNLHDYDRRVLSEADRDRIMAEVNRKKMSW